MLDEVEDYVNGKPIKQYRVLVKSPVYGWRKSLSHNMMRFQAENLARTFADDMNAIVVEEATADTLLMFLRDGGTDG
jgi:hypothetical protein